MERKSLASIFQRKRS